MLGHAKLHMRQGNAAVTDDGVSDLLSDTPQRYYLEQAKCDLQ